MAQEDARSRGWWTPRGGQQKCDADECRDTHFALRTSPWRNTFFLVVMVVVVVIGRVDCMVKPWDKPWGYRCHSVVPGVYETVEQRCGAWFVDGRGVMVKNNEYRADIETQKEKDRQKALAQSSPCEPI